MTLALIVDDHALFRSGLSALLKTRCGFAEIVEAEGLDDAVDILGAMPRVTLAVFDLAMPGMVSAASLRSVCESFPTVRTVVMTGSNVRNDIFVALDAGVHGFILKTAGADAIVTALRWVLNGNVYVPPEISHAANQPIAVPSSTPSPLDKLTPRQQDILYRLASGRKSNKEIARELDLTENTVKVHVIAIFRAFEVHDRRQIPDFLKELGVSIEGRP